MNLFYYLGELINSRRSDKKKKVLFKYTGKTQRILLNETKVNNFKNWILDICT